MIQAFCWIDERRRLYSAAGIPEYWIVNLGKRSLEVHRRPVVDSKDEFGHRYSEVRELGEAEMVAPLSKPGSEIQVMKFFE